MKTNSDTPQALCVGLDVHKAQTVLATFEQGREAKTETSYANWCVRYARFCYRVLGAGKAIRSTPDCSRRSDSWASV